MPTAGAALSWVMMFQWASGYGTVVVMGTLLQVDTTPLAPRQQVRTGRSLCHAEGLTRSSGSCPGGGDKKGGPEQGCPAGVRVEGHPSDQASWLAPARHWRWALRRVAKEGQLTVPFPPGGVLRKD